MLKQYNFRVDPMDIKALDGLGGCRSVHIRSAIQSYLHNGIRSDNGNGDLAMDYISELKKDKDILQRRLDYFMLPWYQKLLLPKP